MKRLLIILLPLIMVVGLTSCLDEPTEVTVTVDTEAELLTALDNAEAGDLIEIESGTYGEVGNQSVVGPSGVQKYLVYPNDWETNVWVRPAPGATVNLGWRSKTPNLTLAGGASSDEVDNRTLIASIVYLDTGADKNEVIGLDRIDQSHVRAADDTIWLLNRMFDPGFEANDGIQLKRNTADDPPERTYIIQNTIGPIYRKSSAHHGDCIQTVRAVDTYIVENEMYPCSNASIQMDNSDEGDMHVLRNVLWGCNPILLVPDPEACDSTGNIKGGSRTGDLMRFEDNVFHSGGFSLTIEGPGDMYYSDGNTFDSEAWPGLP